MVGLEVICKDSEFGADNQCVLHRGPPASYDIRCYFGGADFKGKRVKGKCLKKHVPQGSQGSQVRSRASCATGVTNAIKCERLVQKSIHHFYSKKHGPHMEWYVQRCARLEDCLDSCGGHDSDDSADTQTLEGIFYASRSLIAMREHWKRQMHELSMAARFEREPQLAQMMIFYDRKWKRQIRDHPEACRA